MGEPIARSPDGERPGSRLGVGGWLATAWVLVILVAAALGPVLPIPDPSAQGECTTKQPVRQKGPDGKPLVRDGAYVLIEQPGCSFQEAADDRPGALPSARHLLGNDQIGRDLLSRVVAGARTTVVIAFGSVLVALVIGGAIGMLSAYVGGRVDAFIATMSAATVALPAIVLTISLVAAFGRTTFAVWLALTLTAIPVVALISRTQALSLVTRDYVSAARMLGAPHSRVLLGEVLPNLAPFALVFLGLGIAAAVGAEGGLSVIGLSVSPPATSWGAIISDGKPLIQITPHVSLIPSMVMFLTILSITRLTDWAASRLGVRQSLL